MRRSYQKILGPVFFETVKKADAQLLGPSSFQSSLQSLAAIKRDSAAETTPGTNKFFFASASKSDARFGKDGHFTSSPIDTAPGFVFGHAGFEGSRGRYQKWISPHLAPYIHEYDHFVIFALQEKPMLVAMQLMGQNFKIPRLPLRLHDIEGIAFANGRDSKHTKMVAQLLTWAYAFQEFYELSTRIIDREIFLEMGLRVPQSYFEISPKSLRPYPMPSINLMAMISEGDSMYGYSLEHRLHALKQWVQKFNATTQFHANFIESFGRLEIRKRAFGELTRGYI